jgi:hypothetical protein
MLPLYSMANFLLGSHQMAIPHAGSDSHRSSTSCGGAFYLLPKPSSIPNSHVGLIYYVLLFIIIAALVDSVHSLHSLLPYGYKTLATVIWAVAAFAAVAMFRTWSTYVHHAWKAIVSSPSPVHPGFRMQMASLPVAQILQWVLFLIGIVCTLIVLVKLINFCGRLAASGVEGAYSRPAVQSADVIISLLHISHLITELMAPIQAASADVKGYSYKRSKITTPSWNVTRKAINSRLSLLADQIKGTLARSHAFSLLARGSVDRKRSSKN